jgi:hypothetical protein
MHHGVVFIGRSEDLRLILRWRFFHHGGNWRLPLRFLIWCLLPFFVFGRELN